MMDQQEKFCLKWNDFEPNISKTFSRLRNETQLADVTLIGNDHHQVAAHKVVLSACSDVFKTIFCSNSQPNFVLYLDSIDTEEIKLMMDYIYHGEVKIFQDNIERFLEIANKYHLEGLLSNDPEKKEALETKKHETEYQIHVNVEDNFSMGVTSVNEKSVAYQNYSSKIPFHSKSDEKFNELVVKENGLYHCTECQKTFKDKAMMRRHIETHMTGLSYDCHLCGQHFRSRNSLNSHIYHKRFSNLIC